MKNLAVPYKSQWDPDAGMTNNDCGPAGIAMILNYYGENLTTNQVFQATGADQKLITFTQMKQAVESLGYQYHEERNQTPARIKQLIDQDTPPILLVHYGSLTSTQDKKFKGGHFLVCVGYRDDGYFVNDPNFKGDLRSHGDHHNYTKAELEKAWQDCSLDKNPVNSLIWIGRKPHAADPSGDQQILKVLEKLETFRSVHGHGNLEGALDALIGRYHDSVEDRKTIEALKTELRERDGYIQGQKETVKALQEQTNAIADMLSVERDFTIIKGELRKLLLLEDEKTVVDKKLETAVTELDLEKRKVEARDSTIAQLKEDLHKLEDQPVIDPPVTAQSAPGTPKLTTENSSASWIQRLLNLLLGR